jgi:hypothetical protein
LDFQIEELPLILAMVVVGCLKWHICFCNSFLIKRSSYFSPINEWNWASIYGLDSSSKLQGSLHSDAETWKKHFRLISTPHVLISLHDCHGWSLFLLWLFFLLLELLKQLTSTVLSTSFSCCKFFMDIFPVAFTTCSASKCDTSGVLWRNFFSGSRRPFLCLMGRCFACTGTKLSRNPTSWLQLEWRFSLLFDLTLSLPTSVFSPTKLLCHFFDRILGNFWEFL